MDVICVGGVAWDEWREAPLKVNGIELGSGSRTILDDALMDDALSSLPPPVASSPGGPAANAAAALAGMGLRSALLGVVGKDKTAKDSLGSMNGADVGMVKRFGRAARRIALLDGGDRALIEFPQANRMLSFTEEDAERCAQASLVHFAAPSDLNSLNAMLRLRERLDDGAWTAFAPYAAGSGLGAKAYDGMIASSRLLLVSPDDVRALTGLGPLDGCRALLSKGPKAVVSRSPEGSLIVTANEEMGTPARRTVAVDPLHAADVHDAALMAAYVHGAGLRDCAEIARDAAALAMAARGRDGYPGRRFLDRYAALD